MEGPTLAEKLGTTTHLSPLLRRVERLGLGPLELRQLAVQRGCRHYETGHEPQIPLADRSQLSDEELALALVSVGLPYEPHNLRCGAAMLSAPGNAPEHLAFMAVRERCEIPVRQIAESGRQFEPDNPFWTRLLVALPNTRPAPPGVLPHPTRYVAMTGFTRRGRERIIQWLRPRPGPA